MLENYSLFTYIVFIIDGLVVGFAAGLFAIGGGTAVVPVMTTILGYSPKVAVGISVFQMVFSSIYNSYLNYKKGTLVIKQAIAPSLGGFCGGICVIFIMKIASNLFILYIILGLIMWAIAKLYISPAKPNKPERTSKVLQFCIGFIVGLVATSGGIGGGALLAPALVSICYFELKKAASIGGLFVAFAGGAAFLSMASSGLIDYTAGIIIAICSLPGVKLGNWCFHKTTLNLQKKLMIGFLSLMWILSFIKVLEEYGVFK